jgi:hypothetical protein
MLVGGQIIQLQNVTVIVTVCIIGFAFYVIQTYNGLLLCTYTHVGE